MIGTFFEQNGAAIIIAAFGALPPTVNIILTYIGNKRTLENRVVATTGRVETDKKIDTVQAAVENGYHAAVAVAADVAATKVLDRAEIVGTKVVEKAEVAAAGLVEKAKEVATAMVAGEYIGPNRRTEDKGPPPGIGDRRGP